MNNTARINRRVPRAARGISLLRIGAVVVLAVRLLSVVLAVTADPLSPGGIDGAIVHGACPDAYDAGAPTDDLRENASLLIAGAPPLHNFDGNTLLGVADKDWARFTVVRTAVYTLTTSDLSAQTDTVIELYDFNGDRVTWSDNAAGLGLGSRIVWTAPLTGSGLYYLSVFPTGTTPYANCAGTVVSYTLSMNSKVPLFIFLPILTRN